MSFSAKCRCIAIAIAASLALPAVPVVAAEQVASYRLNLPAQAMADSLRAVGKAAHVNIVFDPAAVAGRRAPVLQGDYTPYEALERLLAGSGLSARPTSGGSFAVEPPQAQANSSQGGPRRDEAGVYTFDTMHVRHKVEGFSATRMPTALKDVPQTVTVIDQKTLREQNANDMSEAFKWAPGITLSKNGGENNYFSSRGFEINTIHVDGGAPLKFSVQQGQLTRIDLSEYERIEVLRGADALFGGIGNPGGSINLTRKRPLAENAVSVAASAGSWDHYRMEADLSAKLTDDGRLRGRLVAVNESEHYFYDTAQRRMNKLYAVGEYDLRPGSRVTMGGSYDHSPDFVSFNSGLPRYADGRDARLPRSTALTFPWAKNTSTSKEGFLQLEHGFNERWKLKAGVTRAEQEQSLMSIQGNSAINPVSQTVLLPSVVDGQLTIKQTALDLSLLGSFDWNGRTQEVLLGADFAQSTQLIGFVSTLLQGPPINVYRFDPSLYTAPPTGMSQINFVIDRKLREHGLFASVKLRPADGWSVIAGARRNAYRQNEDVQLAFGSVQFPATRRERSDSGLITPFLGVVRELNSTYSLYASYAETTTGGTAVFTSVDGTLLDPSQGSNSEIGLKGASRDGRLNSSIALFKIRKTNVAVQIPTQLPIAGCCYIPTTQQSKGVEAELSGLLAPGWQLSGGYTFNMNRQGDGSVLSTTTPRHSLKLWTNYQLPGGSWEVGGGVIAQSRNYARGRACAAYSPSTGICAGAPVPFEAEQGFYSVVALRAGYHLNDKWNVALNIDNLFDRRYYSQIGQTGYNNFYGEPRNWTLTLRGEF